MFVFVQISFFLVSRKINYTQLRDEAIGPVNTENIICLLVKISILIINPQFPKFLFFKLTSIHDNGVHKSTWVSIIKTS